MSPRRIALCILIAGMAGFGGTASQAASVNVEINAAPPPPRVVVAPTARRGYVWVPGYWRWNGHRHIWVNGQLPRRAGYPAPATIQGHNMPNRVVLGTQVRAGDKFEVAIFGINGPISVSPANTVWFRYAKMDFYQ